jgi:hypothetical protein
MPLKFSTHELEKFFGVFGTIQLSCESEVQVCFRSPRVGVVTFMRLVHGSRSQFSKIKLYSLQRGSFKQITSVFNGLQVLSLRV